MPAGYPIDPPAHFDYTDYPEERERSSMDERTGGSPIERKIRFLLTGSETLAQPSFASSSSTVAQADPIAALRAHMTSVPNIFGHTLPGPTYIQTTEGKRNGEVVFIIHPNGDIISHQWDLVKYEWTNIGMYSFNRKKVEGTLSHEQLKGQKIGSAMPRNTLEYFIAIAKQYEETSIAKASEVTGYERSSLQNRSRPTVVLPQHMQRPLLAVDTSGEATRSFSSAGWSSQTLGLPTLASFQSAVDSHPNSLVPMEGSFSHLNVTSGVHPRFSTPGDMSSSDISPLTRRKSMSPEMRRVFAPNPRNNLALAQSGLLRFDSTSTSNDSPSAVFGYQRPQEELSHEYPTTRQKVFQEEHQRLQQKLSNYSRPIIEEDSDVDLEPAVSKGPAKASLLSRYLDNGGTSTASEKALPPLHYLQIPMPQGPYALPEGPLTLDNLPWMDKGKAPASAAQGDFQYPRLPAATTMGQPPTSAGSLAPRAILRQSEAEANYHDRQVPILSQEHTADMSNDELRLYGRPTPQNWNLPFLQGLGDSRPPVITPLSDENMFNKWWNGGTKFDRQEDYLKVQERAAQTGPSGLHHPILNRNGIERILLQVRENLQAYVDEGPNRSYFNRWSVAPAHAVDDTPRGRQSFFGEDHGPLPARVGRDPRVSTNPNPSIDILHGK